MKKFVIASIAGAFLLAPLLGMVSAVNTTKNSFSWFQTVRMAPTKRLQRQEAFWEDIQDWKAEERSFLKSRGFGVDQNRKAVFEAHYQATIAKDQKDQEYADRDWAFYKQLMKDSYRDYDRNLLGDMTMEEYRAYLFENWQDQEDLWKVQTKDWSRTARAGRRSFNRNMHSGTKRSQRYHRYEMTQ